MENVIVCDKAVEICDMAHKYINHAVYLHVIASIENN